MDPEYSRCVQKVFVELYKKGLIYRGKRMVNWCPASQTALSDEEVEMKPQKGFTVLLQGGGRGRAEYLSDHRHHAPRNDSRRHRRGRESERPALRAIIGKHVVRPLPAELPREQKLIPIIGDEHVDFEFGTGVLKVTPAHDKADFEIGQRHKLPAVEVINRRRPR